MGKLSNKVALITGGNSGMGLETAKLFALEGAKVVITGRREKEVVAAAKDIGHGAIGVAGDVSNLDDLDSLYKTIKESFGRLDILFANAGVGYLAPLDKVTPEHFDTQFNINVRGLYFTVQKALPLLNDGSSIILNASVAAQKGMEAFGVYCATKAAVRSFARSFTSDLKARKIRVNSISPGPIETPIFGKMGLSESQVSEFGTNILTQVPMGRMGTSEEIAKTCLFLASNDSSYITGADICVDGGMVQV